ncbi:MAG: MBL fold metallo-hydrolase, partial [Candidatus Diapherotrites archaeon]|nr:MBL fold metallo-hydrolase [Candidatus Diapherotrites archaeon]
MSYESEIKSKVSAILPKDAQVSKVELEGPEISIYTKNPRAFLENERLVKSLVSTLKKRVNIRCDSTLLKPEKESEKLIREIVPEEAQITDIKFVPPFNQVTIEAIKFGLIIGKGGETIKRIMMETGWTPKPLRAPLRESKTLKGIRHHLVKTAAERKKILKNTAEKIYGEKSSKRGSYLKITALGAARQVGRSCFLLETANSKVLLDCGIGFASKPELKYPRLDTMGFPLSEIDAVVLSHAHLDHSGFVPYLYSMGCTAPLYCTEPTRDVSALLQFDYVKLASMNKDKDGEGAPYSDKDVREAIKHCIPLEYGEVTDIAPDLRLTLSDAGHIIGSSTVHIHEGDGDYNLVYTGDLKFGFTRLHNSASINFPRCETIMIESTYGR